MRKGWLFLVLSLLGAQPNQGLFTIETRTRVLDGDLLEVVVQVDNNSDLIVSHLEGFVTVLGPHLEIVTEQQLTLVQRYEPGLEPGRSASRSLNFPFAPTAPNNYVFHIARLQFVGDYRVYTYHPATGLIRID